MLFKFKENERNAIKDLMRNLRKTQYELAPKIGYRHQRDVSNMIRGKKKFSSDKIGELYEFLEKDPSVAFLLDYQARFDLDAKPNPEVTKRRLFDDYVALLSTSYSSSASAKQFELISDLEKLAEKYAKN